MYYIVFGLISAIIAGLLYLRLSARFDWQPYTIWLIALSVTTFTLYILDKTLSKLGRVRVPEIILHLLTILGGFPGGWLGRLVFRHKTNVQKHPSFLIVLILSTIGHSLVATFWLIRAP